jgi:general stress protein 26
MSQHQIAEIWSMIADIEFAMLTTEDGGKLRSRPMYASQSSFDGTLWFFTKASSHKIVEVAKEQQVCVSYADPAKQNYVSLSGTVTVVRDHDAVDTHWTESMRTWFAKGKDDPEVALLRVDISEVEYWDAPNSTMVHAYGYVKALMTGESPHSGKNEKVVL